MSNGRDGISNIVLKLILPKILKPQTLILLNQMLNTGIFLDNLKIAKVAPLYKKKEMTDYL